MQNFQLSGGVSNSENMEISGSENLGNVQQELQVFLFSILEKLT